MTLSRRILALFRASLPMLAALALGMLSLAPRARAAGLGAASFAWPRWMKGFEIGPRAVGHFGKGTSLNSPPGGILVHGAGHLWYEHLVEAHVSLGVGASLPMFTFGLGTKLNLLEVINDSFAAAGMETTQRGLLQPVFPDFMIFFGLDFVHYSFPSPDAAQGQTYDDSVWKLHPSLGVQWYLGKFFNTRKVYVESSGAYTNFDGNEFISIFIGFGFELK